MEKKYEKCVHKMLISCVKLDHVLYLTNYSTVYYMKKFSLAPSFEAVTTSLRGRKNMSADMGTECRSGRLLSSLPEERRNTLTPVPTLAKHRWAFPGTSSK